MAPIRISAVANGADTCAAPMRAAYKVSVITTVILTAAAFLGGALDALAGGGSLVTFPALLLPG